jgi:hypothetical protein
MTETPTPTDRLKLSRSRMSQWLEHDRIRPSDSPLGDAVGDALPFLSAVWSHPATAMVLGAVAKSWCRTDAEVTDSGDESAPLNMVVDQVKQHPKTALAGLGLLGAAAVYWLKRQRHASVSD